MSEVDQRLAEVIRRHYWHATIHGPMCWCGVKVGINDHPRHVAQRIIAELGVPEYRGGTIIGFRTN